MTLLGSLLTAPKIVQKALNLCSMKSFLGCDEGHCNWSNSCRTDLYYGRLSWSRLEGTANVPPELLGSFVSVMLLHLHRHQSYLVKWD